VRRRRRPAPVSLPLAVRSARGAYETIAAQEPLPAMYRRSFLSAGLAAAFAASGRAASNTPKFKLKYAPHPGMFKNHAGEDVLDQIQFSADQGFTAWEDNSANLRPVDEQKAIGKKLEQLGMTMGVFVSYGRGRFEESDFVSKTDKAYQQTLKAEMREAVEAAK